MMTKKKKTLSLSDLPDDSTEQVSTLSKEKALAVKKAIKALEKEYGEGSISTVVGGIVAAVECVPTSFTHLDDILSGETDASGNTLVTSGRGFPKGRIMEIFGPESTGKTTLALLMVKAIQESGEAAAFIDVEHSVDMRYARRCGVNLVDLLFSQPNSAEEALDMVERLARSGAVKLIIVDSVSALVPVIEMKETDPNAAIGMQARLMSAALRKLIVSCARGQCTVIFINQIRAKIGVRFGNPETTSGGMALKFYASIRLSIRRVSEMKAGKVIRSKIKAIKNKIASPFRECFVEIGGRGVRKALPISGEDTEEA